MKSADEIADQLENDRMTAQHERVVRSLRNANADLKNANARLHEEIDRLEKQLDLTAAMQLAQPPGPWQAKRRSSKGRATAELLWSDWHVDERVQPGSVRGLNEWSPKHAEAAIVTLTDNSLNMIECESNLVKLTDLVVWLGGDFLSGPIHKELEITNTMEPDEAIVWLKPRLRQAIRRLADQGKFERVLVVCSFGNHGRWTQKIEYKREWKVSREYWMYIELAKEFADDKRFTWHVSQSYDSHVEIEGKIVCYEHGHRHKYSEGIGGPLIPVNRAVGRRNSKAETRSDLVRMGHFHQHGALANVVMNSSMIGYSEYGAGKFAYSRPSQTFCVIDPKHGQTLVREVFCR